MTDDEILDSLMQVRETIKLYQSCLDKITENEKLIANFENPSVPLQKALEKIQQTMVESREEVFAGVERTQQLLYQMKTYSISSPSHRTMVDLLMGACKLVH